MEMFLCKCKHNGGRGLFAVYGKAFRLKAQQLTAKNFSFWRKYFKYCSCSEEVGHMNY